ncbi:MAG: NYN domain-containing protein [Holophagales bacterium]|nr:NYN domain-containing protein [Holophagales bacterium]
MNPWWRRPAAEERREPARSGAVGAESEEQPEAAAPVEAGAVTAPDGEPGDAPPATEEVKGDSSEAEAEDAESVEPAVSAALEAATEPAEPARATPEATEAVAPAPAKRRRRRRRGGRRSRRGARGGGPEVREQAEAGNVAEARRSRAASTAARSGRAGRAAALLDLGGLERSLGDASEIDTEGLLARLDGELGKFVLRRVYADASDQRLDRNALHGGGVEVVDVPSGTEVRGCSAAVRIVVDALELCYTKRGVGTVVLGATSVQMLPLVAKLQQNGVTVIGLGGAGGDALVRAQCDRFIDLSG